MFACTGTKIDDYLELGDRPAKDLRIDDTRSEPQPPPQKKAKPSPNDRTEEEKPNKFGPSPRPVRNKTNGGWKQRKVVETRKDPFEWYRTTNVDRKLSQGGLQTVAYVKTLITNCIKAVNNQEDTKPFLIFDEKDTPFYCSLKLYF